MWFFPLFLLASTPSASELLRSGLDAVAAGNLTQGRAEIEQASHLAPKDPQVWLALTQVYARLHDDPNALHSATQAIALAHAVPGWESDANVLDFLGKVALAKRDFADALYNYRQAIRLAPYDESFRFDLAQALLGRQQFRDAVEALEDAHKVMDKSTQLELALGVAYYGQRRFSDAVDAFLRTIDLDPAIPQPYVFLGKMLDQTTDRLPDVERRFATYVRNNPQSYLGYLLQAKALIQDGVPPAEPEALLQKSIALKSDNWESHYELGVLLEQQHDLAAAAKELERSGQLNPEVSATHYHLARVYDRLSRPTRAAAERALHQQLTARDKVTVGMESVRP